MFLVHHIVYHSFLGLINNLGMDIDMNIDMNMNIEYIGEFLCGEIRSRNSSQTDDSLPN